MLTVTFPIASSLITMQSITVVLSIGALIMEPFHILSSSITLLHMMMTVMVVLSIGVQQENQNTPGMNSTSVETEL